ncbi:DUF2617 family protein [Rhodococcus phenolicus]|uniref:DUF2617 family protein n=1 Tax=Rhodococcus phenolicus TaxID=263849 RepID=UPI00082A03D2|nr:DUF2617 family protein [Rhodococcus phenolicus]
MTVHLLDVESRDVSAGRLGLVVDAPAPRPLVALNLTDPVAGALTLGVLGASHVVTATARGRTLTEQVSCDAIGAGGRPLPDAEHRGGYRFASRTESVSRRALGRRAETLRAKAADRSGWLCAAFPGDRDALTVLTAAAADGQWHWRTWHLYPYRDESVIVETESRWQP